ncbi:MAG TPA: ComF family protein [Pseudomonadales bacterium]|nr:ComF family protein [Pseudomonadales bacterium]
MASWLDHLLFALVPGSCILCDAQTRRHLDLCCACERELPRIVRPCHRCGLQMGAGDVCGRCLAVPPPFERCFAPFRYAWPIDRLVSDFKQRGRIIVGKMLAHAVSTAYIAETAPERFPDVLVPVPLHKRRLRHRGFNQSVEIADVLSDHTGRPVDNHLCRRVKDAAPQKSLDAKQRSRNLRDAFAIDGDPEGLSVAIVDDVVTTAATVSEISRLFLARGASRVEVIALARTPLP